MHYFYIIYSEYVDRFYIGETNNLMLRLEKHNSHLFKKAYTKIAKDWKYVLTFETQTRVEALFLESFIKKMKSRKFIKKVIQDTTILEDLLIKR